MRVTQGMLYLQSQLGLARINAGYAQASAQATSGKRINQPSDDASGSIYAQYSHRTLEDVTQYTTNVGRVKDWVSQDSSTMQSILDQITQAQQSASLLSTGTYTEEQRGTLATTIQGIMDEIVALGNTQVNGRYIYSGTRTDTQAATSQLSTETPVTLDGNVGGGANQGSGRLYGQGTYTGRLSRNITLTVQAGYGGGAPSAGNPMNVDYSYVDDYGRTISGTATISGTGSGNAVDLGDGVQFYADAQSFAAGDQYTLTVGRQQGNDQQISANLSQDNLMTFNHTLQQILGQEGNVGGSWGNLLDQLADWKDSLDKDSKTQTYFEAVPGTANDRSSTADMRVSGDWEQLQSRAYNFVTGGPIQSSSPAASRALFRNFTVDAAYAGGVPSAANPMTIDYDYWNGAGWTSTTATITGTGAAGNVTLDPTGTGTPALTMNVVDAAYSAGQALPLAGSATAGAPPYIASPTTPSAGQPVMVTYTYLDANQVRQWGTTTFTGSGDGSADVLSMNPPGEASLRLNSGGTLKEGDTWDLTLQQYNQGQSKSQQMLTNLAAERTNLLRYTGDAGAKLNRLEIRNNLLGDDKVQLNSRLSNVESADISQVSIDLQKYQTMFQAALSATAMISSHTLADYL